LQKRRRGVPTQLGVSFRSCSAVARRRLRQRENVRSGMSALRSISCSCKRQPHVVARKLR
jgi:hypothetical protein